jgi:hypothetical protein
MAKWVARAPIADRLSTFFPSDDNGSTMTVGEGLKGRVLGKHGRGATKGTDRIRRLLSRSNHSRMRLAS